MLLPVTFHGNDSGKKQHLANCKIEAIENDSTSKKNKNILVLLTILQICLFEKYAIQTLKVQLSQFQPFCAKLTFFSLLVYFCLKDLEEIYVE